MSSCNYLISEAVKRLPTRLLASPVKGQTPSTAAPQTPSSCSLPDPPAHKDRRDAIIEWYVVCRVELLCKHPYSSSHSNQTYRCQPWTRVATHWYSGVARILKLFGHRNCMLRIEARSAEKNFLPSFFSYQDGLSWYLRASHFKQSLLSEVTKLVSLALALFMLALLHAPSTNFIH